MIMGRKMSEETLREPTASETEAYRLRLIRRILRDMLKGVREDRSAEGLTTDRDTMFLVLPDSFRVAQIESWIDTMNTAADLLDAADFYRAKTTLETSDPIFRASKRTVENKP